MLVGEERLALCVGEHQLTRGLPVGLSVGGRSSSRCAIWASSRAGTSTVENYPPVGHPENIATRAGTTRECLSGC